MPKFNPDHNTYSCPICSDDVSVALPISDKFVICTGCGSKLSVDIDAEFENGMWHDLTSLFPVKEEPVDKTPEEDRRRMLEFAKKKRCSSCSGTGKVITMGIEEECGFCEGGYYTPEEEMNLPAPVLAEPRPGEAREGNVASHAAQLLRADSRGGQNISEECEHQYTERTTAPLGVSCIKCGHFVGAWE